MQVDDSRFTNTGVDIDLSNQTQQVKGSLRFGDLNPWEVTFFSPGAMGWYAFVPKMEDYHGVVSFSHPLEGSLEIDGRVIDFSGGKGYIEKDWGMTFPKRWIWAQTNHFPGKDASISLSIATIPRRGKSFTGYIIGFWLEGQLFRFSTYAGGKIRGYAIRDDGSLELKISGTKYDLEVWIKKKGGVDLKAPVPGGMAGHVNESLNSEVSVKLTEKSSSGVLFSGTGTSAGAELHGDIDGLLLDAIRG